MCDFVHGEVLISFPDDPQVREAFGAWFHDHGDEAEVDLLDTLENRLNQLGLPASARVSGGRQVWRVGVPHGQELYMADFLRQRYHLSLLAFGLLGGPRADGLMLGVSAGPNHLLSLTGSKASSGPVTLTPFHDQYKAIIGLDSTGGLDRSVIVGLVDSGADGLPSEAVVRRVDLVTPEQFGQLGEGGDVSDLVAHGSGVASIINDVAPGVKFMIYRVSDGRRRVSEWDVVAALRSIADADIVNLSLAFGFDGPDCGKCGRRANSSRSIVFEDALKLLMAGSRPPIVVASSGNAGLSELHYPARFTDVVAVGSLTSRLEPSTFSNVGTRDHLNRAHPRVWFLPGGDNRQDSAEAVATVDATGKPLYGTSFACAYATGVIARLLTVADHDEVLERLRSVEGTPIQNHNPGLHGHGLMSYPMLAGPRSPESTERLVW